MRLQLFLLAVLAVPAVAGEYAVLSTGFRIHADRHEVAGDVVRLHSESGVIELPSASIVTFEPEDYVEPAPTEPPADPVPPSPESLIADAAERYGVPAELIRSVALAESALDPDAVSPKGAIGVMQLMPGTAAELGADPHDIEQNVDAGARRLRDLLLQYDGGLDRTLAAYNAGPGAVARYNGVPPYRETQDYVRKVVERYRRLSQEPDDQQQ